MAASRHFRSLREPLLSRDLLSHVVHLSLSPQDITLKHRYILLRKKLSNLVFRRKLRQATNGEMIRVLSCIKDSLRGDEQRRLGDLITTAIKNSESRDASRAFRCRNM